MLWTWDSSMLKGRMREKGLTYKDGAKIINSALSTFCQKINGKSYFTADEIDALRISLEIPIGEIGLYFFYAKDLEI